MSIGTGEDEAARTLAAAQALAPQIRAAANAIEQGRRLTPAIVQAMKQAGIFRMAHPRAWGGPELSLPDQVRVIEELAYADGSVGWCAMINIDGGYLGAFIDQDVAREMYRDLDAPTAASLIFTGRAVKVDGGYRVTGRWPFASGCQHCEWIGLTCALSDSAGNPILDERDRQQHLMCMLPISSGEILDTWHTTGLRGSGSNDFAASDVFVPAERVSDFPPRQIRRPGPLYAFPMLFGYKLPGITIGIARAAIDSFMELARKKFVTSGMLTGRKTLVCDEPYVQSAVGQAEALVAGARTYIYDRLDDLWNTLVAGNRLTIQQRTRYRLAVLQGHANCLSAVELLYKSYGGAAVYASGPLDRALRDLHTINQHTMNSPKIYETAGRVLMGLDPRPGDALL
jgi:alkylation response protein AidB-like acyl-CoA dehydrogenase